MNASMMILSSRVIAVNREALIEGSSGTGAILSLDVMYLCDNTVEKGVLLGRVKMVNDVPSPAPFLLALQDILNRVAGLTPIDQTCTLSSLHLWTLTCGCRCSLTEP